MISPCTVEPDVVEEVIELRLVGVKGAVVERESAAVGVAILVGVEGKDLLLRGTLACFGMVLVCVKYSITFHSKTEKEINGVIIWHYRMISSYIRPGRWVCQCVLFPYQSLIYSRLSCSLLRVSLFLSKSKNSSGIGSAVGSSSGS